MLNVWRELDLKESIFIFATNQFDLEDAIQKVVSNNSSIVVSTSDFQPQIKGKQDMEDIKESTCELSHTYHYQKQSVPRFFLFFFTNSIIIACSNNSGDWVNLSLISWEVNVYKCTRKINEEKRKLSQYHFQKQSVSRFFFTNSIIMACSNNSDDWPGWTHAWLVKRTWTSFYSQYQLQ